MRPKCIKTYHSFKPTIEDFGKELIVNNTASALLQLISQAGPSIIAENLYSLLIWVILWVAGEVAHLRNCSLSSSMPERNQQFCRAIKRISPYVKLKILRQILSCFPKWSKSRLLRVKKSGSAAPLLLFPTLVRIMVRQLSPLIQHYQVGASSLYYNTLNRLTCSKKLMFVKTTAVLNCPWSAL